jgi:hypothetical protein
MTPRISAAVHGNLADLRFSTPRVKMMMHEMSPIAAIEGGFLLSIGFRGGVSDVREDGR